MTDSTVTADREQLFAKLADPATTGKFFERVSDTVSWTVMGTHPLAGTYTSKQAFFDSTFAILGPLMRDGIDLEVRNLHVTGDYTIAELQAIATTTEGVPFDDHLSHGDLRLPPNRPGPNRTGRGLEIDHI
jgi:hypothetical protein